MNNISFKILMVLVSMVLSSNTAMASFVLKKNADKAYENMAKCLTDKSKKTIHCKGDFLKYVSKSVQYIKRGGDKAGNEKERLVKVLDIFERLADKYSESARRTGDSGHAYNAAGLYKQLSKVRKSKRDKYSAEIARLDKISANKLVSETVNKMLAKAYSGIDYVEGYSGIQYVKNILRRLEGFSLDQLQADTRKGLQILYKKVDESYYSYQSKSLSGREVVFFDPNLHDYRRKMMTSFYEYMSSSFDSDKDDKFINQVAKRMSVVRAEIDSYYLEKRAALESRFISSDIEASSEDSDIHNRLLNGDKPVLEHIKDLLSNGEGKTYDKIVENIDFDYQKIDFSDYNKVINGYDFLVNMYARDLNGLFWSFSSLDDEYKNDNVVDAALLTVDRIRKEQYQSLFDASKFISHVRTGFSIPDELLSPVNGYLNNYLKDSLNAFFSNKSAPDLEKLLVMYDGYHSNNYYGIPALEDTLLIYENSADKYLEDYFDRLKLNVESFSNTVMVLNNCITVPELAKFINKHDKTILELSEHFYDDDYFEDIYESASISGLFDYYNVLVKLSLEARSLGSVDLEWVRFLQSYSDTKKVEQIMSSLSIEHNKRIKRLYKTFISEIDDDDFDDIFDYEVKFNQYSWELAFKSGMIRKNSTTAGMYAEDMMEAFAEKDKLIENYPFSSKELMRAFDKEEFPFCALKYSHDNGLSVDDLEMMDDGVNEFKVPSIVHFDSESPIPSYINVKDFDKYKVYHTQKLIDECSISSRLKIKEVYRRD